MNTGEPRDSAAEQPGVSLGKFEDVVERHRTDALHLQHRAFGADAHVRDLTGDFHPGENSLMQRC